MKNIRLSSEVLRMAAESEHKRKRKRGSDSDGDDDDDDEDDDQRFSKMPRSETVCQERGDTIMVLNQVTDSETADAMINKLFTSTLGGSSSSHNNTPPPPTRAGDSCSGMSVTTTGTTGTAGTSPILGNIHNKKGVSAAEMVTAPIMHKPGSSQQLRKAYESQAHTWNASDSVHGIVRKGDLESLKARLYLDPDSVWQRDECGANILHMSLLINGPKQRQIACYLLEFYPKLLTQPYDSDAFAGEMCLHFPIVHKDTALARLLVGRYPEALRSRAKGTFFREPKDGCYFGEYPLLFAVSTNQPDLVSTFLEVGEARLGLAKGDHLTLRDTDRNTVLHMCVHHNNPGMYDFMEGLCLKHCPHLFAEGVECLLNIHGYSPFTLAAKLGRSEIFAHLLKRCAITEWRYGPVNCRKVLLTEIDRPHTPGGSRTAVSKGVLQILEEEQHSHLLMHPLILQLQQVKWDTFAGRYFMNRTCFTVTFIVVFFVATVVSPGAEGGRHHNVSAWSAVLAAAGGFAAWSGVGALCSDLPPSAVPDTSARLTLAAAVAFLVFSSHCPAVAPLAELLVAAGASAKLVLELREMYCDWVSYFGCRGAQVMENVVSLSFSLCSLGALGAKLMGFEGVDDVLRAGSALFLWVYFLWLLLGFRMTGPFVIMIWKMLCSDMIRFLLIFVAFLFGFAQTFFILSDETGVSNFLSWIHICFVALIGGADLESTNHSTAYPALSMGLLLVYVLLVSVLLLNLLVAMMSSTYTEIQEEAEEVWRLQWTRLIFSIESEMTRKAREDARNRYWTMIEADGGMKKKYLVLPMKVGEEELKRYQGEEGQEEEVQQVQAQQSDLSDLLEDPRSDGLHADATAREFADRFGSNLSKSDLLAATHLFTEGGCDPVLSQLLVGVRFAPNGADLLDLLSRHYFASPPPSTVQKARCARFLGCLLQVQDVPPLEVRSVLSSFARVPGTALRPCSPSRGPSVETASA